jgi:hydrophobic/amphiphilic exporter-1 (mainly G- bacteria), HAE1 family
MKRLVEFAVAYPVTILMMVLGVLLLGTISFQRLGMDLFPELNNPRIYIELQAGEEPPEEIETRFVKSIEAQAIRQKNALQVSSVSQVGSAQIVVEYAWETAMDEAYLDIQKALTNISQNEEIDELTISQYDPNATPIILLGFSHPGITDMDNLRKLAESYIRNELIRLEGIADVRLYGQEEKEVLVETNQYLLETFNLNTSSLASRIQEYNRNVSGGSIVEMGTKYIVKGVSEFASLEAIEQIIVTYKQAEQAAAGAVRVPVFLKDVADVSLANKEPENIVHLNQTRCMALAVYKETQYNTVNAVDEFMETLETLRAALPGYELTIIQNKGAFITDAIDEVQQTLLFGILLAVIILFVFLRRLGATAIISIAIPISIVATFNLMYYNGLTVNIMTLGGLALGAGMLVDNAIVVMENIFRNLEEGKSLREASIIGTSQVSGAITASTITTIVVFLPIVYLHGSAGELFKDQAWTVAFSLISSLGVAIFVIPTLSTRLLKRSSAKKQPLSSVHFPRYAAFLGMILRARWAVIAFSALLVAGAALLAPKVGSEFIPKTEMGEYTIDISLAEGTELYRTESTVANIEQNIQTMFGDQIAMLYSIAGSSGDLGGSTGSIFQTENTAVIQLIFNRESAPPSAEVYAKLATLLSDIPDMETRIYQEQTAMELTMGSDTDPVVIEIQGEDLDELQVLTETVADEIAAMPELFNIETNFDEGRPEINIVIDRLRAGAYNIGINAVSSQLQSVLMGAEAGAWDSEGELKDITIKLPRISVSQLDEMAITSGESRVMLHDVADIERSTSPREIYRRNQARLGMVTANLTNDVALDHVARQLSETIDNLQLPPEYRYRITGEEEKRKEAFDNLQFALLLSLALVYMVLASQFESLLHPFTIIFSVPLAGVGAVAIFYIMGQSFNIMAYIGIIMLVGIAVNDSIILVDTINQLKRNGLARTEAIIEAGQRRIRPIIMTSLTTILALFPLTLGLGEGAELRAPMALAVIGGLITATLLTLIVIPCVYAVLDKTAETIFSK